MEPTEARYMRRKVKAGLIEADHDECAIVVHYEVEATVLGELGEPIVAERQENTKRIKLKTLSENTNIQRLAGEILEKCKLIHTSKLEQVEQLLQELVQEQNRRSRAAAGGGSKRSSRREGSKKEKKSDGDGTPSLADLERYVEQMYEGTETATKATYMILQLARSPENLESLLENEALLGLLSRLLQEEGPKSMDLAINIIYILYSFSNFSQFHQMLYQARVGNNVLEVVELEAKRHRVREIDRERNGVGSSDDEKRYRLMLRKQEKLLYVCFHVLLNLAEEPDIERKMAKRGIVGMLVNMLSRRQNTELLVLSLLFLMKLAIFKENLPALRERPPKSERNALPAILPALQTFIPNHQEALLATSLRLLFNLSFDQQLRAAIVSPQAGLLPKMASLLKRKQQLPLVLRLLYNLSAEPDARVAIGATDAPRHVMKQVLTCAEPQLPLELAALAINIASDANAAGSMSDQGAAIRQLVDRLYKSLDPHLIKLMRNLAQHEGIAVHLSPFVADLIALAQQVTAPEILVEILGILGSLPLHSMAELPALAAKYSLTDFLARHLTPGFSDDDVLLEVVIVIGQMAGQPECAARFAQSRVLTSLYTLITEKQDDDEIVLQILYAFFHLLQGPEPRYALLQQTQLVIYLLDLLHDKNGAVRRMANLCLDVVIETDETWASQIRQRKFQMHNREWLDVVDEDEAEEYQDAVALNNAMASLHMSQPLDAANLDNDQYAYDDDTLGGTSPYPTDYASVGYNAAMYGAEAGGYGDVGGDYSNVGGGYGDVGGSYGDVDGGYGYAGGVGDNLTDARYGAGLRAGEYGAAPTYDLGERDLGRDVYGGGGLGEGYGDLSCGYSSNAYGGGVYGSSGGYGGADDSPTANAPRSAMPYHEGAMDDSGDYGFGGGLDSRDGGAGEWGRGWQGGQL